MPTTPQLRAALLLGFALLCRGNATAQRRAVDDRLTQLAGPHASAVLLFFVASDCPVSNRYFPEMERLSTEFAPRQVSTRYVYPNPDETTSGTAQHQRQFGADAQAATLDPHDALVHLTGVTTTPEAALLLRRGTQWTVAYRGRIDDRYVHFGEERSHAEHHDVEDAVRAALDGRSVPQPGGPPVGCAIVSAAAAHEAAR